MEHLADPPALYGLDIETDTTIDGLDPTVGRVLAVAVAGSDDERVFAHADEATLLENLDDWLRALPPGVLVTWNGARFDLPYLATRSDRCGVELGLRLEADPSLVLRGRPLPGHVAAYRARWHHHAHLDAFRVFLADLGPALRVSCSLKSVANLVGLGPVETDASRVHELPATLLHAYVASDARCTRELVARRWASAAGATDRLRPEAVA